MGTIGQTSEADRGPPDRAAQDPGCHREGTQRPAAAGQPQANPTRSAQP
ncbi:MAG: hypothetical protein ACREP1_04435, partial [Rhodanobacteraceae bacterium]